METCAASPKIITQNSVISRIYKLLLRASLKPQRPSLRTETQPFLASEAFTNTRQDRGFSSPFPTTRFAVLLSKHSPIRTSYLLYPLKFLYKKESPLYYYRQFSPSMMIGSQLASDKLNVNVNRLQCCTIITRIGDRCPLAWVMARCHSKAIR